MDFLLWVWNSVIWLISLARPENLKDLVKYVGVGWVYATLFGIVFAETGLVIGFFLPGDSLLFTAGFLAGSNPPVFDFVTLNVGLIIAAIVGDAVNYSIGASIGSHVFEKGRLPFVKQEHLLQAKAFYEKHGGKAIVLARFVPIVRTFTPLIAGVAKMKYSEFAFYNIFGGIGWVLSMTTAGYFIGGIPIVQKHFEKVVILIIVVSVLPIVYEWWKHRQHKAAEKSLAQADAPANEQTPSA